MLNLARSGNASNVQCHISTNMFRHRLLGQDVTYGDSASGFEQAKHLVENDLLLILRNQVDDAVADDAICAGVRQVDIGDEGFDEAYIDQFGQVSIFVRSCKHILRQLENSYYLCSRSAYIILVNPDCLTLIADFFRGLEDIEASAGTKIYHSFALD